MNTAQLRSASRDAASLLCWQEAADLLNRAIEAYPKPVGALAKADLDRMRALAANYQAMLALL